MDPTQSESATMMKALSANDLKERSLRSKQISLRAVRIHSIYHLALPQLSESVGERLRRSLWSIALTIIFSRLHKTRLDSEIMDTLDLYALCFGNFSMRTGTLLQVSHQKFT